MNRIETFEAITKQMFETYMAKNDDYGNSVADTYDMFGITSFMVRMYDKLNRAITLSQKGEQNRMVKDEKLEDTLLDLANYSIMAIIEMRIAQDKNKN